MKGSSTNLIHLGEGLTAEAAPLVVPVYETTTFVFDSAEEVKRYQDGLSAKFLYSRYENPTVVVAERKLAALDGAEAALVFSSGMAATATALATLLNAGDEIVCGAAVYGGTYHLIQDLLTRFQIQPRFVALDELAAPERILSARTRALWFESPINPTLRCVDIRRVTEACRARNVVSILDNTFASPINQQPLALGADIAMQSATKYLNGHSDVTAGALTGPARLLGPIGKTRRLLGTVLDPHAAFSLSRGLKTLALRVARHNANGADVANFLQGHARVGRVHYPGLTSHPDHEIAAGQMCGFGGMVTIDVGSYERAAQVFDRFQVIKRAASLGGAESLASLPVLTSHYGHSNEALQKAGVTAGMIRLSIGLEDASDVIADLDQALS
jgi:cystathionine beta-lyase/cystathionine gamma-synthase